MKKITLFIQIFIGIGCGNFSIDPTYTDKPIEFDSIVSECGGLESSWARIAPGSSEDDTYCDAEMLHWTFDEEKKQLTLLNARILLNCCGEHDMIAEKLEDDTLVVTEFDDPEILDNGVTSRCHCICVFDYQIAINNIEQKKTNLKLKRDVEEESEIITVFEGVLNLSEKSGSITIDESDVDPWCEETG